MFAVYRKAKRTKDLILVQWPVDAADDATAVRAARELLTRGVPHTHATRRLCARAWDGPGNPPVHVPHYFGSLPLARIPRDAL